MNIAITESLVIHEIRSKGSLIVEDAFPVVAADQIIVALCNRNLPTNPPAKYMQVENVSFWVPLKKLDKILRTTVEFYVLPLEVARKLGLNSEELRNAQYQKQLEEA